MAEERKSGTYQNRLQLLTEAVEDYQTYLVNYAYGYTRNWQDAENIVQELWKYVIVYYKTENLKSLSMLRRKVYLLFLDQYRSKKRKPLAFAEDLPEDTTAWKDQGLAGNLEESRLKSDFFGQFEGLDVTELQKDVFWLHARYGFTFAEISEQTGKAASTLGDWIAMVRKKIAGKLEEGD